MHIEFQQANYQKMNLCNIKKHDPTSKTVPESDKNQDEIRRIDWLVRQVITQQRHIPESSTMADNGRRPLGFLQSVGRVKLDFLPELKYQIDSWFFNLRDKMFSQIEHLKESNVPGDMLSQDAMRSKIHQVLSKAHGQIVMGIIGSVVMLNHEMESSSDEGHLVKKCWTCILEHFNAWENLTTTEIRTFLQQKESEKSYKRSLAIDPVVLIEYLFQHPSDSHVSSGCIWDILEICLQSQVFQARVVPPFRQFAYKLNVIKDNMEANHISGISHNKISLYSFQLHIRWSEQKMV